MVLSNKKLKQKLRSLLVESLASSEHSKPDSEVSKELRSLKETLSTRRSQRSRPPRKRTKKEEEKKNDVTREKEVEEEQEEKKKKKGKKRKRDDPVALIEEEGARENANQSKEQRKKKKKKKKDRKTMMEERKKNKKKRKEEKQKHESSRDGEEEKPVLELGSPEREVSWDAAKKVYVGGIPYYSSEEDIVSFFEGCGTVTEVDCMMFPESGKFRGIAFLTFKTEAAAKRALDLDGSDMGGFYLKVQPYKPARPAPKTVNADFTPKIIEGYNRVYVGNLSWEITEDELRNFFSECDISEIRFGEDKTTGEFKGYAHIDFSDKRSLTEALKMDQEMVCGRPVRIRCAVPLKKSIGPDAVKTSETAVKPQGEIEKPENNSGPAEGGKKKRRTCYNCGVPGHISSACPKNT